MEIPDTQERLATRYDQYPVDKAEDHLRKTSAEAISKKPLTLKELTGTFIETTLTGSTVEQRKIGEGVIPGGRKLHLFEVKYNGWPSRDVSNSPPDVLAEQRRFITEALTNQLSNYIANFFANPNDRTSMLDQWKPGELFHPKHINWTPIDPTAGVFKLSPKKASPEVHEKAKSSNDQVATGIELNAPPGVGKSYLTKTLKEEGGVDWIALEAGNRANTGFLNEIKFNYAMLVTRLPDGTTRNELYCNLFGGNINLGAPPESGIELTGNLFQKIHPDMFPGAQELSELSELTESSDVSTQKALNNLKLVRPLSNFEILLAYMQKVIARDFVINVSMFAKAKSEIYDEIPKLLSTGGILQDMIFIAGHLGLESLPQEWLELLDKLPYKPKRRVGLAPEPADWLAQVKKDNDIKRLPVLESSSVTKIYADLARKGIVELVDPKDTTKIKSLASKEAESYQASIFIQMILDDQEIFLRSQRYFSFMLKSGKISSITREIISLKDLEQFEKEAGLSPEIDIETPFNLVSNLYITEELGDMLTNIIASFKPEHLVKALKENPKTLKQFKQMTSFLLKQSTNMAINQTEAVLAAWNGIVTHYGGNGGYNKAILARGERGAYWHNSGLATFVEGYPKLMADLSKSSGNNVTRLIDAPASAIYMHIAEIRKLFKRALAEVPSVFSPLAEIYCDYIMPQLENVLSNREIRKLLEF